MRTAEAIKILSERFPQASPEELEQAVDFYQRDIFEADAELQKSLKQMEEQLMKDLRPQVLNRAQRRAAAKKKKGTKC